MIEWLDEFYDDELRTSVVASLEPVFSRYAADVWRAEGGRGRPPAAFVTALATAYADHHVNSSRIQLQALLKGADNAVEALRERFAEWMDKRPAKVAANETVRTANALAVERMRSSGITRKVWSASGISCPYCSSLHGRTVEVLQDFFAPGDEFSPEGAERPLTFTSSIGHPPIHAGCDCVVVEG